MEEIWKQAYFVTKAKQFRTLGNKKDGEKPTNSTFQKERSFNCRECEGYGHFQTEYLNFLKKENRSYVLTLSDDDFEDSGESEEDVKALVSNISSDISPSEIS